MSERKASLRKSIQVEAVRLDQSIYILPTLAMLSLILPLAS